MTKYMENFERWLKEPKLEPELRQELALLRDQGEAGLAEIEDRFYTDLEFGTGGLRGILGAGTNRMNVHTVARSVRGLADYILENQSINVGRDGARNPSVAIGFDSRIKSDTFAKVAANVLLENGIDVYLFQELMPTPALSFATRHYKCNAGIMITASHNPSKYNGLKVYNRDGCQETLVAAERIMEKIEKLDPFVDIKSKGNETGILTLIPEETVAAYIDAVTKEQIQVDCGLDKVHVVFTPLNGTGNKPIRSMLSKMGVGKVSMVKEQEYPDGNFTTCPYPNPEKEEALKLGKNLFLELYKSGEKPEDRPDVLLASDPDADRIGVACFKDGEAKTFSGNEIGVLMFDFICNHKKLPENPVAIRTIVSTKMVDAIARKFGVQMVATLTGFKFIGEQIGYLEEKGEAHRFVFGFEESVGYLTGSYVRDKDAVDAAMLVTQMVGYYKKHGKNLFERLEELYLEYGCWQNGLIEFAFEGAKGIKTMGAIMDHFRTAYFEEFAGLQIVEIINYKKGTRRIIKGDSCCSMVSGTRPTNLPSSDVMEFVLENGSGFAIRPSGTEPKFKIYMGAKGSDKKESQETLGKLTSELTEIIDEIRE